MVTAIVVGVGAEAGLGGAVCKRIGRGGLHVFVAGRTPARIEQVAAAVTAGGGQATAIATDTTVEADVVRLFDRAAASGPIELVVFNAGSNQMANLVDMEAAFFENVWRVACFGGFLVGREAARRLAPQRCGTVLFTGATGSLRARPPFIAFASAKAALRAVAQAWRANSARRGCTWRM